MPGTSKKISDLNAIATMHDTDLVEVSNDNQDSTYTSVKATIGDVAEHVAITTEFTNDLDTTDKTLVGAINEVAGDIPTVNDATLSIQVNSTEIGSFTANASSNETIDITVPTTVAELSDASDYATVASLAAVATSGDYGDLLNPPTIPAAQVNSDWDAVSGVAQILNKPTIPAAQVNSDWNSSSGVSQILNKPTLATVATSGSYNDLSSKPNIPTVNDATITFTQGGTTKGSITLNQSSDATIALDAGGGGGGGHTILDDEGTSLTQRADLQFKGAYSIDNNTDQITEVNVVREMTALEFEQLSADEKVGIINVTDATSTPDNEFQPVIYSETEREIGVWIDGKPLYQKTFLVNNITISTSDWQNIEQISDIDTLVSTDGAVTIQYNGQQTGIGQYLCVSVTSSGYVRFYCSTWNGDTADVEVTIRYTKTTDTAGSGTWTPQGVPAVHYSTTEHVIGTWIDGSTVYERTVTFPATSGTNFDYTLDIAGLDSTAIMYIADGFFLCGVNRRGLNFYLTNAYNAFTNVDFNSTDNKYHIGGCITGYSGTCYVTVRYTKASA